MVELRCVKVPMRRYEYCSLYEGKEIDREPFVFGDKFPLPHKVRLKRYHTANYTLFCSGCFQKAFSFSTRWQRLRQSYLATVTAASLFCSNSCLSGGVLAKPWQRRYGSGELFLPANPWRLYNSSSVLCKVCSSLGQFCIEL